MVATQRVHVGMIHARKIVTDIASGNSFHISLDSETISVVAADLPDDHREAIRVSAILLGLRQLSLWLGPHRNRSPNSRLARLRVSELANLLEHQPAAQLRVT
jgi:hypothetical protein